METVKIRVQRTKEYNPNNWELVAGDIAKYMVALFIDLSVRVDLENGFAEISATLEKEDEEILQKKFATHIESGLVTFNK
ncbi:MAG: hypothetical protein IJ748_05770 [Bacteroidales bacterium]|nr:hypothetical protein [Bacteroidales bacterium]